MRDSVVITIQILQKMNIILYQSVVDNNDLRRKYIKQYYWRNPSVYKLVTVLSVRNVKELNNLGKYLCLAEKLRNA